MFLSVDLSTSLHQQSHERLAADLGRKVQLSLALVLRGGRQGAGGRGGKHVSVGRRLRLAAGSGQQAGNDVSSAHVGNAQVGPVVQQHSSSRGVGLCAAVVERRAAGVVLVVDQGRRASLEQQAQLQGRAEQGQGERDGALSAAAAAAAVLRARGLQAHCRGSPQALVQRTIASQPCRCAAMMSTEASPAGVSAVGEAPWSSSAWTHARLPSPAVISSGVPLTPVGSSVSAPRSSSSVASPVCPLAHALAGGGDRAAGRDAQQQVQSQAHQQQQ